MKQYLIAITMLLTFAMGQTATAQSKSPKATEELVDSTKKGDALEAYSDTTNVAYDSTVVSRRHRIGYVDGSGIVNDIFGNIGVDGMWGMTFVLMVLVIIFVIAPVIILALLFFFLYKNRKQKMKMAEMAMKQGQPIPDELWQKGLRQTFLGVGLLAFFGYVGSTLGIGVGILVTVIGLGKLAIVKTSKNH